MPLTKAEMEAHRARYYDFLLHAKRAKEEGLYRKAVEVAMSSWEHIDGMMQYARKYEDREFASIETIDIVLTYAPLLFDFQALASLESLLDDRRRIERDTSDDLGDRLAEARSLMQDARRLWNYLEQCADVSQDSLRENLGGAQEQWRAIVERWEQMGLLRRAKDGRTYRLSLVTRMDEVASAKCPACGHVVSAPKGEFLEARVCGKCQATIGFVFLVPKTAAVAEE